MKLVKHSILVAVFFSLLISLLFYEKDQKPSALPEDIRSSMRTRALQYSMEYPDDTIDNIAGLCEKSPIALYWHEEAHRWAVVCSIPFMTTIYGAVILDASYNVIGTERVNSSSISQLEEMIRSAGWVKQ